MMWLVKLNDVLVGTWFFLFRNERRSGTNTPLVLGTVGIVAIMLVLAGAIGIPKAWYLVRTSPYTAELENAAGLSGGDPVYVAGVPAGRVEAIELAGDHVQVAFRLDKGQPLGNRTTATVRLKTVLGKRYLEVVPAGVVETDSSGVPADVIPLSRTTVPYSLDDVSQDATDVAQELDTEALQAMMTTLSQVLPDDPEQVANVLTGVSGVSAGVAENGAQLDQLLTVARSLSELAARQEESLVTTLSNAQVVVRTLTVRKEVLTRLVENLRAVLATTAASLTEHEQDLSEATDNLVNVTETLQRNVDQIDLTLSRLPSALRYATDASGNGAWMDVTAPAAVIPDNALCALGVMQGCR